MESAVSTTIALSKLLDTIDSICSNGKIPFFFDSTGNAETFLKYNSTIIEVAKLQIAIQLGSKTLEQVKEDMRVKFKNAMAAGWALVFYLDKVAGKFKTDYFDPEYLPEEIFYPEKIKDYDLYMKCVRDEENVDIFGTKGNFIMKDGFKVLVLSTRDPTDEDNTQFEERMPMENMEFVVIE